MGISIDCIKEDGGLKNVVNKAVMAWQLMGHECSVGQYEITRLDGSEQVSSVWVLTVGSLRRVEVVLYADIDDAVWSWVESFPRLETWRLRALVPLQLLGEAHNRLCDANFEVQGWWNRDGEVSFGRVEIA